MMAKVPVLQAAEAAAAKLEELRTAAAAVELTGPARRKLLAAISSMQAKIDEIGRSVDHVGLPDAFFDPTDPRLIGYFVALALIAQGRKPLADLGRFYGSGVYAIYYVGDVPLYQPIANTETPIYVGKADPDGQPRTVVEQGTKLVDRLNEHAKNIDKVEGIEIRDFEYRALAVQSGYQAAAEAHLIKLFRPVWNNETKILFGIGKHGDASSTRANNKSPWDTVHPGRAWAAGNPEGKTTDAIQADVERHFKSARIYQATTDVFAAFVSAIAAEDKL
ncbi:MAG: Eco29kI family restriction endonuclease [Gemmobacter sp.]